MNGRSKVLAPVLTVVAVVAVAATAALVGGGPGTARPRVLHLAAGTEARDLALATPLSSRSAAGDYRLVGTLPTSTPADAAAWALAKGLGEPAPVAALAEVLGAPTPARGPDGWTAGALHVGSDAGRPWWWNACFAATDLPQADGPDAAVSSPSVGVVGCAVSGATTSSPGSTGSGSASQPGTQGLQITPAPPPPGLSPPYPCPPEAAAQSDVTCEPVPDRTPTSAEVFAAAGDLLTAVGLDQPGQVTTYPGGGTVTVDPRLDGLPTVGWSTQIDLTVTGDSLKVTSAHGWLAPATRADSYPLISAKQAYDALPAMPRALLACPQPSPGSGSDVACPEPVATSITGAHLGLALTWLEGQQAVLLPAWLFDVQGSDQPLPSVAVDHTYLDTGSTSVTPKSTDAGTIEPAPDGFVPPPVEPTDPVEDVAIRAWQPSTADNAVTVLYENGGCGRTGVFADVKQDATHVYVLLHADAPPQDQVCPANSVSAPYEVALQDPLGDRVVVDLSTGKPVPRA